MIDKLLKADPVQINRLVENGRSLLAKGEIDKARRYFKGLNHRFPDYDQVVLGLTEALQASQDLDGAETVLDTLLTRKPDCAAAHLQKSRILERRNGATCAIDYLVSVRGGFPMDLSIHRRLVQLSLDAERFQDCAVLCQEIMATFSNTAASFEIEVDRILRTETKFTPLSIHLPRRSIDALHTDRALLNQVGKYILERNRGALLESLIAQIHRIYPASVTTLNLMALALKDQGRSTESIKYYFLIKEIQPDLLPIFKSFVKLTNLLYRKQPIRCMAAYEEILVHHPHDVGTYRAYVSHCIDICQDLGAARRVLAQTEVLGIADLRLSQFKGLLSNQSDLATGLPPSHLETGHPLAEDRPEGMKWHWTVGFFKPLSSILARQSAAEPNIVLAEATAFDEIIPVDRPVIALFAYALPRPNLDIIYFIKSLLDERGHHTLMFINLEHINKFDFSEICLRDEDIFYASTPNFFYSASFIDCIISNDGSQILATRLPRHTKLVFHAPHNTNDTVFSNAKNLGAHYTSFLNNNNAFENIQEAKNEKNTRIILSKTPKEVCLIPNSYTKNEYLYSFVSSFQSIGAVCFAPTTYIDVLNISKENRDLSEGIKEQYLNFCTEFTQRILSGFEDLFFIYRPFWGHDEHSEFSQRYVSNFFMNERFLVDDFPNSKYALAASNIFITDWSGLGNTFSDLKGVKHARFTVGGIADVKFDHRSKRQGTYTVCDSVEDILDYVKSSGAQLEKLERSHAEIEESRRRFFSGATYFADNFEYILSDRRNPNWYYLDFIEYSE
ncbi:MAG: tetratricopeptide repeat protein [Alphaproteobacteria bacterium]|nr:tetratricopeptide repeat protein [Alphaproteobacteria bacterium]